MTFTKTEKMEPNSRYAKLFDSFLASGDDFTPVDMTKIGTYIKDPRKIRNSLAACAKYHGYDQIQVLCEYGHVYLVRRKPNDGGKTI